MGSEPAKGHWGTFQGLMRSISRGLDWPSPDFTTETAQLFLSFELGVAHHHSCSTQRQQDRTVLQILFCNSPPRPFWGLVVANGRNRRRCISAPPVYHSPAYSTKKSSSSSLWLPLSYISGRLPLFITLLYIPPKSPHHQTAAVYHSPVYSTKSSIK